ncbi:hypothetical protein KFK09_001648 [Dendrobium nobile]|uniref:Uncharacterized protein n=1 Tax=Dendrobium nobile TaxID=94219 RepID=A0A8T3CBG9_DENNO|nr:hypothetical protein KFK09_001648 [Dendrobium nobile]
MMYNISKMSSSFRPHQHIQPQNDIHHSQFSYIQIYHWQMSRDLESTSISTKASCHRQRQHKQKTSFLVTSHKQPNMSFLNRYLQSNANYAIMKLYEDLVRSQASCS